MLRIIELKGIYREDRKI